jgi:ferredoxin-type protein NapH
MKYKSRKITKGNFIKWIIWLPWIVTIILLAFKNGGYNKIDPFYQTSHGISVGNLQSLITYFAILALIVIPAFLIGKRAFCYTICWMAPFMILGRKLRNLLKWPSLQLLSQPDTCTHCHTCDTKCPMSLPVEDMVQTKKWNTMNVFYAALALMVVNQSRLCLVLTIKTNNHEQKNDAFHAVDICHFKLSVL